jgi:hypothetical protein
LRNRPDALVIEGVEFSDREAFEKWRRQVNKAASVLWPPTPKKVKNEQALKAPQRIFDAPVQMRPLRRDLPPLQD